jgi:hypothetical protein
LRLSPQCNKLILNFFEGVIKSLGAWVSDFVMVVSEKIRRLILRKGFETILSFDEMILK